ncbi:DUF4221 domain-containing protein [Aquiflexum gelatinilyticum]|uniref:DUF4221 domain-containing protein n=1 Tax=Aquiflexum gelatinilyticum TaxID=2961943 RepID=A0A9X2P8N2_9BACT|nr:DUF4221 domain-containing protein [Aquiflexum gelatinilyticum]MCR9016876.1 DUF4221 domain-containing protein [Aquiflexum gelatinilyticum]MCS4433730.1 DUF4221 domain-containing protein [Aquiflexum gelatinilyticum]
MKNILFVIFILFIFSCENTVKEEVKDYSKITLTMDTVMVDSGDEIINLKYKLYTSTMSEDNKFLYLWNNGETTLDKINLEELRLEKKIQFESEGPNGVGRYVGWLSFLNENEILLSGFPSLMLFDMEGNKTREYPIIEKTDFKEVNYFERNPILLENGEVIYGYLGNRFNNTMTFVKSDFKEKKLTKIELPGISELPDYRILLETENMGSLAIPEKFVKKVGDRLIISSTAYSTFYVLDLKNDSVFQVSYTPKLTPKEKKGGYPEKVESLERFRELMAEIDTEINFQSPVWDEQNRKFYRFSFEALPSEINEGPVFLSADQRPISKVYLSVFNESFNLLGETLLDGLKNVPNTVFVRDGQIWSYVNVDDELGFVRMTINYE